MVGSLIVAMRTSLLKLCMCALLCSPLLPNSFGAATNYVPFAATLSSNSFCTVDISILHPTQCAVGAKEVEMRAEKVRTLTTKGLENYLRKHVAPIVIGPKGVPYLLDHQHLARVLQRSGASKVLYAEVKENWSDLSVQEFWTRMKAHEWVYLHDETGKGPVDPANLPQTIEAMRDDPYRSVAWLVRKDGGYLDTSAPFADFQWADFFRARIHLGNDTNVLDAAAQEGMKLARSPEAKALPGYIAPTAKTIP